MVDAHEVWFVRYAHGSGISGDNRHGAEINTQQILEEAGLGIKVSTGHVCYSADPYRLSSREVYCNRQAE